MPETTTQYYHLTKPEVGHSENVWGDRLNADLDQIDTQLFNRVVKTLTGSDAINGAPQVIDTSLWVAAQQDGVSPVGGGDVQERSVATARWVETRIYAILNAMIPIGTIVMWSGTGASIPGGWTLCNGLAGGDGGAITPNLSDRIVLAVGNQHEPGEYGGYPSPGLGPHVHQGTQFIALGVEGAPEFLDDYGGAASFGAGGSAYLPYYCVCYIMKYKNWAI